MRLNKKNILVRDNIWLGWDGQQHLRCYRNERDS